MSTYNRIIEAALNIWRIDGATAVSLRNVAKVVGMSHVGLLHHVGTAEAMRDATAKEAVRIGDPVIVPQLIVSKHDAVAALSEETRRSFLAGC